MVVNLPCHTCEENEGESQGRIFFPKGNFFYVLQGCSVPEEQELIDEDLYLSRAKKQLSIPYRDGDLYPLIEDLTALIG